MLKRITVGLVVSTFLLAIFRYVVKLYQANYDGVIQCDREDMRYTSFYVAYKGAAGAEDMTKVALASLLAPMVTTGGALDSSSPMGKGMDQIKECSLP